VLAERQRTGEAERLPQIFKQAPGAVAVLRGPKHVLEIVNPAYTALVRGRDVIAKRHRLAGPRRATSATAPQRQPLSETGRHE
jgi:hypothetical protein